MAPANNALVTELPLDQAKLRYQCEAGSEASGLFSSTHKPKIHACETNVKHFSSWYSHVPCCGTASSRPIGVVWTLIHSWPLSSLGRLNIEVQPLTVNNQCTTGNLTYVHKDIFMYAYCTHTMCVYMFSVHKRSTSSLIH